MNTQTITGKYLGRTIRRVRIERADGSMWVGTAERNVYLRWGVGQTVTVTYHRDGAYNVITKIQGA